jgi:hypothetical protein
MMEGIETMTKTANKKNHKDIKLLNSANEVAACLVKLPNNAHDENFSNLKQMQAYMKEQVMSQKKSLAMKVVKKKKRMVIRRCQKHFNFKLNINNVCQLYSIN